MQTNQQHINYTFEDIEKYFQGRMSAVEMHELEKDALQDGFLADAMEGYKNSSLQQSQQDLEEIKNKISHKKQQTKIVPLITSKKWIWAAASVIGIILISSLFWLNNKTAESNNHAVAKNAPLSKPDKDSISITHQQPIIDSTTTIAANTSERKKKIQQKNVAVTNNNQSTTINNDEVFTVMNKPPFDTVKQLSETIVANEKTALTETTEIPALEKRATIPMLNPAAQALEGKAAEIDISNNSAKKMFKIRGNATTNSINKYSTITGKVIDANGNPITGASVILLGNKNGTQTNNDGYFSLATNDSILKSTVAAIGYNSTNQTLYKNKPNNIVLNENVANLDEVVIVGYGSVKKKSITGSSAAIKNNESNELTPEGGWDNFKIYITTELKNEPALEGMNIHGTYNFKFGLDKNNRPQKIKITSSPNKKINSYFIKALQNGTKWHLPKRPSKKYKSTVNL